MYIRTLFTQGYFWYTHLFNVNCIAFIYQWSMGLPKEVVFKCYSLHVCNKTLVINVIQTLPDFVVYAGAHKWNAHLDPL